MNPKIRFKPEDLLTFIELEGFADDWKQLRLVDDDLAGLQTQIMWAPRAGRVIAGTGGLRKLRFAPSRWKSGKSGATRVCYVYLPDFSLILLVMAFSKNQKSDLSMAERAAMKQFIARIQKQLSKGPNR